MTKRMDLNADLGEGCAYDAELMSVVTSCNIACGGHAGDEASMRAALSLAKANDVSAGAHPSFPDKENFGRTKSDLRDDALEKSLTAQVQTLNNLAAEVGIRLMHLKPHGALYNMAARDADLSQSICAVVRDTLPGARLVGPPGSQMEAAAKAHGIAFVAEGFADRAYEQDGQLRDRKLDGAVFHDPETQVRQASSIAMKQTVQTHDGAALSLPVQTLCVHGDTPGAFAAAQAIRAALEAQEISICPPD